MTSYRQLHRRGFDKRVTNGKWHVRYDYETGIWRCGDTMRLLACVDCGDAFIGGHSAKRCSDCKQYAFGDRDYALLKSRAHAAVAKAIRDGALRPPREFQCVDCYRDAEVYDHRDYTKPLDVQPVCRGCNLCRGPAIQKPPQTRKRWVGYDHNAEARRLLTEGRR